MYQDYTVPILVSELVREHLCLLLGAAVGHIHVGLCIIDRLYILHLSSADLNRMGQDYILYINQFVKVNNMFCRHQFYIIQISHD